MSSRFPDAGFIVRGSNNRPIGAVIVGRGASVKFSAWNRDRKLGEFTTSADATNAVRQAHSAESAGETAMSRARMRRLPPPPQPLAPEAVSSASSAGPPAMTPEFEAQIKRNTQMTTNLDIPHRLSPEERALLGAADDFGDFPSKGPPRSGVTQLASKDLDPQSPRFVAGAQAGSIVLRYGVGDDEVVKTFDFMPFAAELYFSVYEPDRGIERGAYVETLNEKPADARWQADDIGRQRCLLPNGNEVRETKVVYMIVGDGRSSPSPRTRAG